MVPDHDRACFLVKKSHFSVFQEYFSFGKKSYFNFIAFCLKSRH